jgi:hypothetical protein
MYYWWMRTRKPVFKYILFNLNSRFYTIYLAPNYWFINNCNDERWNKQSYNKQFLLTYYYKNKSSYFKTSNCDDEYWYLMKKIRQLQILYSLLT